MQIDLEKLKNDNENIALYFKIMQDADRLNNLYWSVGGVNAGNILLDVAHCQLQSPSGKLAFEFYIMKASCATGLESKDPIDVPLSVDILEQAINYFCTSEMLANFSESKKLRKAVLQKKDLFAGFEKYCKDWESARKVIEETIDKKFQIPGSKAFFQKAYEKARDDFKQHHSTVKKAPKL